MRVSWRSICSSLRRPLGGRFWCLLEVGLGSLGSIWEVDLKLAKVFAVSVASIVSSIRVFTLLYFSKSRRVEKGIMARCNFRAQAASQRKLHGRMQALGSSSQPAKVACQDATLDAQPVRQRTLHGRMQLCGSASQTANPPYMTFYAVRGCENQVRGKVVLTRTCADTAILTTHMV